MLNEDALADDFATILGYRTSHEGLVKSGTYSQNRVAFDGVTFRTLPAAYAVANPTGVICSVWLDLSLLTDAVRYDFVGAGGGTVGNLILRRLTTNKINVASVGTDGAINSAEAVTSVTSFTAASGVVHVMASWRTLSGSSIKQLVVNGATEVNGAFTVAAIAMVLAGDRTANQLGASGTGTFPWLGQAGDFFAAVGEYDITDSAVQAKFRTAGGLPVSLGATGLTPTGAQPGIFFGADMTASTGGPSNTGWNGGVHYGSWGAFSS